MNAMTNKWGTLLLEYLKRDWKLLLVWVAGLAAFSGGFVPLFVEMSEDGSLAGLFETMQNPAMVAMVGTTPVTDAASYTLGPVYAHMMLLFCGVFAMVAGALHMVAHTRGEEDSGLAEFVGAYGTGRHAATLAMVVEHAGLNALLALCTAGIMVAFGEQTMPAGDCVLFGASVGAAGMMGSVIGLVFAQVMPTSAGATGVSLAVVGGMYVARAATDMADEAMSWFVPMGWTYLTYPFTENDLRPLALCAALCVVALAVAFALESRRDAGAGYVRQREGSGKVSSLLLSVPGLLTRLNRGAIAAWLAGYFVLSAAYGSIYGDMQSFLESSEMIKAMFTVSGTSIEASFTSVISVVMACLAAVLPMVVAGKLFSEESAGRFAQLLSTKASRLGLYGWAAVLAAACAALSLAVAGLGLGAAALATMEESSLDMADFMAASLVYFPAVLLMTGLVAAAVGWAPRLRKVTYGYLGFCLMVNYFMGMLDMPEWFEKLAVFSWVPRMPIDEFDPAVFAAMTLAAVALFAFGAVGYVRRDLREGK